MHFSKQQFLRERLDALLKRKTTSVFERLIYRLLSVTFDDEGEVSIAEGSWAEANPTLVVGVVDPLVPCGEHVQHPLHCVIWTGPEHVPVDHPLPVPHPVPGPHHAATHTLQHHPRPSGGAHIIPCHHHAAAVRLSRH